MSSQHQGGPVAVCDVRLEHLTTDLVGLETYARALLVLRMGSVVVGQAWVEVNQGRVPVARIKELVQRSSWSIWQHMLAESLPRTVLPSATVVVCTRDRTDDMRRCLPGLARLAEAGYEVLVVDNNPSSEATAQLVAQYPLIRYLCEPLPGLDRARNRGLLSARGEIVAFTDDDAVVDDGWLEALLRNFADPMVALVTGITMPLELETPAQIWFEQAHGFQRGFERRTFELATINPLSSGQMGAGVNMAIRRQALRTIGLFDEALDGGSVSLSGGDQEFFFRVLRRGYRVVYEPGALVWHRHRRDWPSLRRTLYGYGVGLYAWWTRALLVEREWQTLIVGVRWFRQWHLRNLVRALLRRPGVMPLDLAWAEFQGVFHGPGAYLRARQLDQRTAQILQGSGSNECLDTLV
ncbi:glycosyltransferase [Candidatus Chloroploca sp. M-50]|uniref:Glycosyltransferase n=1 Tax=Candidatus Chloroploca mongolica TaxID=2528176 RepID=A0ABS4D9N6_9CHLR|nr:glycosyltransferase [Candidatus Chloroploca mongolica]MBP1466130.1 glycosyltransferase [Candidatus Chloroploca mongolica]